MSSSVILSVKPKEYLKQGKSHCGVYTLKAVLSAFGKDTKNTPEEYHEFLLGKIKGSVPPGALVKLLRNNGLEVKHQTARKLYKKEKIDLLKSLLKKNLPVILLIGNGYHQTGEYDKSKARFTYHWISLWGYNDDTKEFYLYDSAVPKNLYDNVPIGNKKRSYEAVIRDWGACIVPWYWTNYYIEVSNK